MMVKNDLSNVNAGGVEAHGLGREARMSAEL